MNCWAPHPTGGPATLALALTLALQLQPPPLDGHRLLGALVYVGLAEALGLRDTRMVLALVRAKVRRGGAEA